MKTPKTKLSSGTKQQIKYRKIWFQFYVNKHVIKSGKQTDLQLEHFIQYYNVVQSYYQNQMPVHFAWKIKS